MWIVVIAMPHNSGIWVWWKITSIRVVFMTMWTVFSPRKCNISDSNTNKRLYTNKLMAELTQNRWTHSGNKALIGCGRSYRNHFKTLYSRHAKCPPLPLPDNGDSFKNDSYQKNINSSFFMFMRNVPWMRCSYRNDHVSQRVHWYKPARLPGLLTNHNAESN